MFACGRICNSCSVQSGRPDGRDLWSRGRSGVLVACGCGGWADDGQAVPSTRKEMGEAAPCLNLNWYGERGGGAALSQGVRLEPEAVE